MTPPTTVESAGNQIDRPLAVWIEDGSGAIVRGLADYVAAGGVHVRLAGPPTFEKGAGVVLRICLDPERPIVATTARVSWVNSTRGDVECGLEWTERATIEQWLASRN